MPEVVGSQVSSKVGFARRDREGLLIFKVLVEGKEGLEVAKGHEQFLVGSGVPKSNSRYIVTSMTTGTSTRVEHRTTYYGK